MDTMSKPTILRVKRRLEENPQDAFVISCKRSKTAEAEAEPSSSLFVFSGTADALQENLLVKNLVPKENPKLRTEINVKDIVEKLRKERKDASDANRYKIVKRSRGLENADENFDFIDLELKEEQEGIDAKYAYDFYVSQENCDFLSTVEDSKLVLLYGHYKVKDWQTISSEEESSDDSNDENNWRNDYPDEENSSIGDDDMLAAMQRVDLDDLSTDDDEYKIEPTETFAVDALRYGTSYAKYKAKILASDQRVDDSNLVHCSTVQDDGYDDDSDNGFYYGQDEDTDHFKEQYKDNS